jgi:hypothetical protein
MRRSGQHPVQGRRNIKRNGEEMPFPLKQEILLQPVDKVKK